ncbi:DNA topoisomerase IV subunit B family protein [Calycomorphotria hydatis]|nr:hypothetical protein [Calycomorphotria hydatis]
MAADKPLITIEGIRLRPAMYIGGMDSRARTHLVQELVLWLVSLGAREVHIVVRETGWDISVDPQLTLGDSDCRKRFEQIDQYVKGNSAQLGPVIANALSTRFMVAFNEGSNRRQLSYQCGKLHTDEIVGRKDDQCGVRIEFEPDLTIFSQHAVNRWYTLGWLERSSWCHEGVRYTYSDSSSTEVFYSESGIESYFRKYSTPYCVLSRPIKFQCGMAGNHDETIRVRGMLSIHTGPDEAISTLWWGTRIPMGGIHEDGLRRGIQRVFPNDVARKHYYSHVPLAVMLIEGGVGFAGATKDRVDGPESLSDSVADAVEKTLHDEFESDSKLREEYESMGYTLGS